ncbi:MAG: FAD-dependent monooxygenase [Verrucomicrobia bacterium]|nr:FAD-dependent monooxygenase [Verrucomicrobiota bacterium]
MFRNKKVVVLGASLGGLSAAISLLEKGIPTTLIDAASGPFLKTCGEFLSHEAIDLLAKYGIRPTRALREVHLHYENCLVKAPFTTPCASMPRLTLENLLLEHFLKLGGNALLATKVHNIVPGPPFQLYLDKGEVIHTKDLVIATGRFQGAMPVGSLPYRGIKTHYHMASPPEALHMVFFKGGYYGLSPLDHKTAVFSCLVKQSVLDSFSDNEAFLKELLSTSPLQEYFQQGAPLLKEPLTTPIGRFGLKKLPDWQNSYFIGDAAATIAPLSGQGMTIALTGGEMAADYIGEGLWQEYRKAWQKRYRFRINLSRILHSGGAASWVLSKAFPLLEKYPKTVEKLFTLLSSSTLELRSSVGQENKTRA